ncbi:MATH domain and coiled-coil domain-containing protein At2g01790-like [Nicotiana tabacum]|uniref:MATH domain and coiled-coil domain-containing protein At2g01790-like n=1 Tax=Nicotiana tabacum TaxID=4097 RepID=A0AC58UNV7_TOBAC
MEKTGAIVSSHKVTVEIRDASPSHYLMKFESFYKLSENDIDMYESNEFEAWGYKWKLIIYPKGDDNIEGNDYISVYLAIANDSSLPAGWEANAVFSFFLFNQLCDNYLVIRDTYRLTFFYFTFVFFPFPFDRYRAFSGTSMFEIFPSELGRQVWRFHKVNCKWGFSKLISHKALKEQSNGYLVDDSIIIGAEVFVVKSQGVGECVSMLEDIETNKHEWKIYEFSKLGESCLSKEFTVGDYKWKILLYPNGVCCQRTKESLSILHQLMLRDLVAGKGLRQNTPFLSKTRLMVNITTKVISIYF